MTPNRFQRPQHPSSFQWRNPSSEKGVGSVEDGLPRSLILRQIVFPCSRALAKSQKILRPRSSPFVDLLALISNHPNVAPFAGQQAQDLGLDTAGVLELIHQNCIG